MDAKIVERNGKFVLQTRGATDHAAADWEDAGTFSTMADAETKEAELKLAEANPDMPKKEVKQTAKGRVSRSAAQQRQEAAEDLAEREKEAE